MIDKLPPIIKKYWPDPYLIGCLAIACIAAWPLISGGGLLNTRGGGDSPFLIERLHQLETAIWDGHFPVRWMRDANYGYGYPFFNFYAPIAFYVAFLYRLVGVTTIQAIQLSQVTAFFVAAVGMYHLGQRWFQQRPAALLLSAAYTLAPFHLVNVYIRGDSIAEFWAMAFYPLTILGVNRLIDALQIGNQPLRSQLVAALPLGFAYAGLIVSHNISAMIFSPFILLYALILLGVNWGKGWRWLLQSIGWLSVSVLVGLLASAWFWLPAIGEQGLTQLSEITVGYFNYGYQDGYHFRPPNELNQRSFFYDPDVSGGRAFRMGLVQSMLIAAGLVKLLYLKWRGANFRRSMAVLYLLFGFALATFMLSPASLFLWDSLPLLPFTQFPWRFLSIQAFFGAGLTGLLLVQREDMHGWPTTLSLVALSLLLVISNLGGLSPDYLPIAENDISPEQIAEYEWFTRNIGTTISAEYLATGMSPRPVTSAWIEWGDRDHVIVLNGDAETTLERLNTGKIVWEIDVSTSGADLVLPTMYWPGWQAYLDNEEVDLKPAENSGLMQLSLPNGNHQLELRLSRTNIRLIAELISLMTLLLMAFLWFSEKHLSLQAAVNFASVPILALLLIGIGAIVGPALPDEELLTWDFGHLGYLHRSESIIYGHGATLDGYRYSADTIGRCEAVEIDLNWTAAPDGDARLVDLSLVTPANNFFNDVAPVSSGSQPLTVGTSSYRLEIPADAPLGLVIPSLTLSDRNRPRTAAGTKRGFLYLKPIRVVPGCELDLESDKTLDLRATYAGQPMGKPDVLEVGLVWSTQTPISENYALSMRLTDAIGREIHAAQRDTFPGFGYRPTGLWPVNEPIYDTLNIQLPEDMPFEPPYFLLGKLYDPKTGETILNRRLGQLEGTTENLSFVAHQPAVNPNLSETNEGWQLGDNSGPKLRLAAINTSFQSQAEADLAEVYEVELVWEALDHLTTDFTRFIHIIDPQTGLPIVQNDSFLHYNTFPTSQMVAGELMTDRIVLPLEGIPIGEYAVYIGLYVNDGESYPRLVDIATGEDHVEIRMTRE